MYHSLRAYFYGTGWNACLRGQVEVGGLDRLGSFWCSVYGYRIDLKQFLDLVKSRSTWKQEYNQARKENWIIALCQPETSQKNKRKVKVEDMRVGDENFLFGRKIMGPL